LRRRVRRRADPEPPSPEVRRRWIEQHAPGRSFADIGGLYNIHGEIAFLAESVGATPVTLFDAGDSRLTKFPQERDARGSQVRFVQGDLEDPLSMDEVGVHDIVWCCGVLYHTPNPFVQLMHLRRITRGLLYLGTYSLPEIPGVEQACIFYPYLSEGSRTEHALAHDNAPAKLGIGTPIEERPMRGHANFWWGITRSALFAMLRAARFEVVEEMPADRAPFYIDVVARPIDADPMVPPTSYFREYGEAVAAGTDPPPFADYYEHQRSVRDGSA
jgi:hypothetical protein